MKYFNSNNAILLFNGENSESRPNQRAGSPNAGMQTKKWRQKIKHKHLRQKPRDQTQSHYAPTDGRRYINTKGRGLKCQWRQPNALQLLLQCEKEETPTKSNYNHCPDILHIALLHHHIVRWHCPFRCHHHRRHLNPILYIPTLSTKMTSSKNDDIHQISARWLRPTDQSISRYIIRNWSGIEHRIYYIYNERSYIST